MNTARKNGWGALDFLKNDPALFAMLRPGDLVSGKVLEKSSKRLLVDLGKYGTGVIYRSEMQNARGIVKGLEVGGEVNAKVTAIDNEEGFVELSLAEVDKQKAWKEVEDLKGREEVLVIRPIKFNRGGLVAELNGLPAFLPISQLSTEHYSQVTQEEKNRATDAIGKLVGAEIKVKIVDVNPRNNKLIVSERAAFEVSMKELAKNYQVGQVIEGVVSGVADFGVFVRFVDNPAVEGLIHISELAWRDVLNPKEILNVDDPVKAKVIDIKDGKIFLSLKALQADPWEDVSKKFKEGKEVAGKIYSFNPFGAVVDLGSGIQGQIHVTEFGGVEEMKKALTLNKEYKFIVQKVDKEARRIVLKLEK